MGKKKKIVTKSKDKTKNMITLSKFSNSAKNAVWEYSSQIRDTFIETGLIEDDVEGIVVDIVDHVVRLSIFYAGENDIVLTDHVSKSISKLGDPSTIQDMLDTEYPTRTRQRIELKEKKGFRFTASKLIMLYWFLSWVLTGSIIFLLFKFTEIRILGGILYLVTLFILYAIKSTNIYGRNKYLRENIHINIHILAFPPIFEIFTVIILDLDPIIMDPILITAWLMNLTSKDVQTYIKYRINWIRKLLSKDDRE